MIVDGYTDHRYVQYMQDGYTSTHACIMRGIDPMYVADKGEH
jgi:hypothetical protein